MNQLTLKCPRCHNQMKYQPTPHGVLDKKVKKCVYCGRSFKVLTHQIQH